MAAILVNPIYAIEIHSSLGRAHDHSMTESQWVAANGRAMEEVGRRGWLAFLLEELQIDHDPIEVRNRRPVIADPFPAVTVNPNLCLPHPPLVDEASWIAANEIGLEEDESIWLRNLLSVLRGGFV